MFLNLIYWIFKIVCLIIGFFLSLEFLVLRFGEKYKTALKFPGPKFYPIIGNVIEALSSNPEAIFKTLRRHALKYKETYVYYYMDELLINIISSKDVEPILNSTVHLNKNIIYEFLHPFLGTGLLTSGSKKWFRRRKILTPAFHFNILQQFHRTFLTETDIFIENLKNDGNNADGIVLQDSIARFTLNTVCETAMGFKISSLKEPDDYRKTIHDIGESVVYRILRPWLQFKVLYWMTSSRTVFLNQIRKAHRFTRNVIQQRRELFRAGKITTEFNNDENIYETKKTRHAMLDTLLASELKGEIDNDGIAEEVDTFMFEGHDTTSAGIIGILLLLAHNPEAQEKIFEEIKEEKENNDGNEFSASQYTNMKYFERVIKECFRIYPPVPFIAREIKEQMIFNNQVIPVGTMFNIHIYDIHRDPEQFPDPEKFDPNRFLPENVEKRPFYSYIPFSAGPRNCIGQKFAMLEVKTLLTKIIWNFRILPITKREDVIFVQDLVLRFSTPIKVKFQLRNK